ncbi:nuclear transport factor 2 family protein [Pantoea sp. B65]|uniref:nuclear transport factor 2 family protein n=1 Tax=Pantoea sp. B65 TaxID=2813359 RepID=UPI0039B45C30
MATLTEEIAISQRLIDGHFAIWNDPDAGKRVGKFSQIYTADFFVADYRSMATGYADVAAFIARVRAEHLGFLFTPDPIAWNHGLGRVTWGYGPPDNPNRVRGEDIFTIRDGRLASLRVFIDKN